MRTIYSILGGMVMLFAGCTNESYTTQELLEADQASKKVATPITAQIQEQVELFKHVFSAYDRDEITSSVPTLYAQNAFLNDRIHTIRGLGPIAAYFDQTFDKIEDCKFTILDTIFAEQDVYLRWTMEIQLKEEEPFLIFLGMTQLRFNDEAQIIYHQDYWDFSEFIGEIRFIRGAIHYIKSRA